MDPNHSVARDDRDFTVFRDIASGALVVDVTGYGNPFDRDLWRRLDRPALVCFGNHPGSLCALGSLNGSPHGIRFEIVPAEPSHAVFVQRMEELVGSEHAPFHVTNHAGVSS